MIFRQFVDPNYSVVAVDRNGQEFCLLVSANSETEARVTVEDRTFKVASVSAYDFSEWKGRARQETAVVIAAKSGKLEHAGSRESEDPRVGYMFRSRIWKELKQYLFWLFHDKCAYCESRVRHVSSGDVEHYRPKKKVEDAPNHPGYYWLAYEASNLLPCCELCNRQRAKMNHFPVMGRSRRKSPKGDVSLEKPLLLHPYKDKPRKDLEFVAVENCVFFGAVRGITSKGEASTRFYHLNRGELIMKRREADGYTRAKLALAHVSKTLIETINHECACEREYSAMRCATAEDWILGQQNDLAQAKDILT